MDSQRPRFSRLDPEMSESLRSRSKPVTERRHKIIEYSLFAVFGVLMTLAGIALYTMYSSDYQTLPNRVDAGIKADRINLLIIGIGGETHIGEGKNLADAIMLVSIRPSTKQVAMISVPRDLFVDMGLYGEHRINGAHAIGDGSGFPGGGPGLLVHTVETIFAQPIHGFVRVDFAAFRKIIDDLGGVEVYVEKDFHDFLFNDGFKKGMQTMNGERALRYARYRYIHGEMGNNFAREERQQQVIAAVQQKLRERSPQQILRLAQSARTLSSATDTNLTPAQMVWLYRNFHDVPSAGMRRISLKDYVEVFQLKTTMTDSGEAVRPSSGNYEELRAVTRDVFSTRTAGRSDDQSRIDHKPLQSAQASASR